MPSRKTIGAAAMAAALTTGGLLGAAFGTPGTSGAQDGSTTTAPADGATADEQAAEGGPGRHGGRGFDLDAATTVLGITEDELRAALAEGKSLADIAAEEGVERQALIDALVAAGEERLDEARAALPERVAELVDGTLPLDGHGRGGGFGRGHGRGADLETLTEVLGLSEEELRTALQDGQSLADIAAAEGVDEQEVVDALAAAAEERLAEAVEAGRLTQEEADERSADLAERIAERLDEVRPSGADGRGPGGPGGFGDGPADDPAEEDGTTGGA